MSRVLTGARGTLKINGKAVAWCSGVNVNQEDSLADVDVIGQLESADLAAVGHKCSLTVNCFKLIDAREKNTAEAFGIETAVLKDMRTRGEVIIELTDESGNSMYKAEGCKWEGGSGQLSARGVWEGNWSFRARKGRGL